MENLELRDYIKKFEPRRNALNLRELNDLRTKFLTKFKFPEKFMELNIESYVIGKEDSFCYWLEKATRSLGKMHIRSSGDYGVFWSKDDSSYKKQEKRKIVHITEDEAGSLFNNIKQNLVRLLKIAEEEDVQELVNISKNLPLQQQVIGKILSLYYPEKHLNIFSDGHLDHFLEKLGLLSTQNKLKDPIEKRLILVNFRNQNELLSSFSIYEFSSFLYETFPPHEKDTTNSWIEKTIVTGRADREEGSYSLGNALWSPQRDRRGADIYRNMRLAKTGDLVLHLIDNDKILGISRVSEEYDSNFKCLKGSEWDDGTGNNPGYLIKLDSFVEFEKPMAVHDLLSDQNKPILNQILKNNKNLFYTKHLTLRQGAYLTKVPKELLNLINSIYHNINGKNIPYIEATEITEISKPMELDIRYWQISPGEQARLWSQLSQAGQIAVGWDKVGDISNITSYDDLLSKVKEVYPNDSERAAKRTATSMWKFKNLRIGDHVLANKGKSKIMGVGKVIGTYFFDNSRDEYKHCVKVDWFDKNEKEIPRNDSFGTTILELTKEQFEELTGFKSPIQVDRGIPEDKGLVAWEITSEDLENNEKISKIILDNKKTVLDQICTAINTGKNIIFIGPPGTGKTEIALGICKEAEKKSFTKGFVMTTATSDWTTFDTIGGLMPSGDSEKLTFTPGQFLRAIAENKILVIDEINRSDIDKAFGQLFTVLSGQDIELQFLDENKLPIIIKNDTTSSNGRRENNIFYKGKNWRILATMNTLDKASLYQMSYAFMRRFAFIYIGIPDDKEKVINEITAKNNLKISGEAKEILLKLWVLINEGRRQIGPAIIKDILELIGNLPDEEQKTKIGFGIVSYILPQFEGVDDDELKCLYDAIDSEQMMDDQIKIIFKEMFNYSR